MCLKSSQSRNSMRRLSMRLRLWKFKRPSFSISKIFKLLSAKFKGQLKYQEQLKESKRLELESRKLSKSQSKYLKSSKLKRLSKRLLLCQESLKESSKFLKSLRLSLKQRPSNQPSYKCKWSLRRSLKSKSQSKLKRLRMSTSRSRSQLRKSLRGLSQQKRLLKGLKLLSDQLKRSSPTRMKSPRKLLWKRSSPRLSKKKESFRLKSPAHWSLKSQLKLKGSFKSLSKSFNILKR